MIWRNIEVRIDNLARRLVISHVEDPEASAGRRTLNW